MHYHGTPITPRSVLMGLAGRNFCVSYAAPADVATVHKIGQSVMLDNGAFSFWRAGKTAEAGFWEGYYTWAERWLECRTTWAVIPDAIDGSEEANDALLREWPFGERGAPVWHMHESLDRLSALASAFPRVCVGSSKAYATLGTPGWHHRMAEAFDALCPTGVPPLDVHMLRGMATVTDRYPFYSVDSTDVARNHHRRGNAPEMAARWDAMQCPSRWAFAAQPALVAS